VHVASRRKLLIAAGATLVHRALHARPARRVSHIAIMHTTPEFNVAFLARLRELGYVEGQNLRVDVGPAVSVPDVLEQLPGAAAQAAKDGVDLIFAGGGEPLVKALQQGAPATPLVLLFVDFDPVARGIVPSLSRPGGNITGVYSHHIETAAKRLQFLKDTVPTTRRVAVLYDASTRDQLKSAEEAAPSTRVTLIPLEMQGAYDFEGAMRDAVRQGADSVLTLSSAQFYVHREKIVRTALQLRLPLAANPLFADIGALVGYGPSLPAMFAQGAEVVDRVLRGSKPAGLAIRQSDRMELVVNVDTARALGLTIPTSVLNRADRRAPG
jgi:ABC-type uncharacterized transport system substrate-binding protein